MAKKPKLDRARVAALVTALRDGGPTPDGDEATVAWLKAEGPLDALSSVQGAHAVQAASQLQLGAHVAQAGLSTDKIVRKAAGAAAHKLRSAGVEVPDVRPGTTWSLGREERTEVPPEALLGMPEEDGYVPFMLSATGPGEACISGGAAGPGRGFRDDDHGHVSRTQARKIMDGARGDHRLHEAPFYEAVVVLESAFDAGGGKRPGGWGHLLSHVDADSLQAARDADPLAALPDSVDEDALHRPGVLLDGDWAVPYAADPEAMAGRIDEALAILSGGQDEAGMRAQLAGLVDEITDAELAGPARASLAWGLSVHAWLAGRADEDEVASVARATSLALADDARAGRDIPWAREWINRYLSHVTSMVMDQQG